MGFACIFFHCLFFESLIRQGSKCIALSYYSVVSWKNHSYFIGCTLRSWVHDIFLHSITVSPGSGGNYASKCSSDNFPHTKSMSPCVENSQNHNLMFCCSPIPVRRFEKLGKLWDRFVPHFFYFS